MYEPMSQRSKNVGTNVRLVKSMIGTTFRANECSALHMCVVSGYHDLSHKTLGCLCQHNGFLYHGNPINQMCFSQNRDSLLFNIFFAFQLIASAADNVKNVTTHCFVLSNHSLWVVVLEYNVFK